MHFISFYFGFCIFYNFFTFLSLRIRLNHGRYAIYYLHYYFLISPLYFVLLCLISFYFTFTFVIHCILLCAHTRWQWEKRNTNHYNKYSKKNIYATTTAIWVKIARGAATSIKAKSISVVGESQALSLKTNAKKVKTIKI